MIIEDGANGLLVEVDNEKTLTKSIKRLMQDDELAHQMSGNVAEISVKFNIEIIAEHWKQIVEKVIELYGRIGR